MKLRVFRAALRLLRQWTAAPRKATTLPAFIARSGCNVRCAGVRSIDTCFKR